MSEAFTGGPTAGGGGTSGQDGVGPQLTSTPTLSEPVANAARHGGANRVRVSLSREDGGIGLAVEDDGAGFATGPGSGVPISAPASLNGRVKDAGGAIHVTSAPGDTNAVIRLPVETAP